MMDRYIDILKLREEILSLPHSKPIVKTDNAKKEKYDNSVDMAGNGIKTHICYVDMLKLREEVLSPPLSTLEPSEMKEVETVDNVWVLSKKQVEAKTHPSTSWKNLNQQTIVTFGNVHRRCIMTLIEDVFLTWTVVILIPLAHVAHRKARERWKMEQKLVF